MKDLPSIFLDQLETGSSVTDALKDVIKEYPNEVSQIADITLLTKII